jgi:outer membrane protein assembly factor BamB
MAYEPHAKLLLMELRNNGIQDAELVEIEETIYRKMRTGTRNFDYFLAVRVRHDPAIVGDTLLFHYDDSVFRAFDVKQKRHLWTEPVDIYLPIRSEVLAVGERIVFASLSGSLLCRHAEDLSEHWTVKLAGRFYDAPLLASDGEKVYLLWNKDSDAMIGAVSLKDGKTVWGPTRLPNVGKPVFLATDHGLVFAGTQVGDAARLIWFSTRNGKILLDQECVAPIAPGVVSSGGLVVAADAKSLFAISAMNGAQVWDAPLTAPLTVPPTSLGDRVVVALTDRGLACYRIGDGRRIWKRSTNRALESPMAASNGVVYIFEPGGHTYGTHIRDGSKIRFSEEGHGKSHRSMFIHDGSLIILTETQASKLHSFSTGDRKAHGWLQKGGGPGRMNRPR